MNDYDFKPDRGMWTALAIVLVVFLIAIGLLAYRDANADDFDLPKPSCYFDNIQGSFVHK